MAHPLFDRRELTRERQASAAPPAGGDALAGELAETNRLLRGLLAQERAEVAQLCVTDREPPEQRMSNFPLAGAGRLIVRRTGAGGNFPLVANTPALILEANENRLGGLIVNAGGSSTTDTDVSDQAAGAASVLSPTLPAVGGVTNYVTGFEVTGNGATAGSTILVTLTGLIGGTKNYALVIPAGVGNSITPLIVEFARPIPATGPNVAITLTVPSFGAGNTQESAVLHGFARAPGSGGNVSLYLSNDLLTPGSAAPLAEGAAQIRLPVGAQWDLKLADVLWCGHVIALDTAGGSVLSVAEV